jgi:hypothetical protein
MLAVHFAPKTEMPARRLLVEQFVVGDNHVSSRSRSGATSRIAADMT